MEQDFDTHHSSISPLHQREMSDSDILICYRGLIIYRRNLKMGGKKLQDHSQLGNHFGL